VSALEQVRLVRNAVWGVVVLGIGVSFAFITPILVQRELRWQLYSLAGIIFLGLTILSKDPRRLFLKMFIVSLSINVHYYVTQPLPYQHIGNSSPTSFSIPLPLLLAFLLLLHQLFLGAGDRSKFLWGFPTTTWALIWIAVTAISALLSSVRLFGIYSLVELLQFYLIFLVTVNALRTQEDLQLALKTLLAVLAFQCCVFFLQTALGFSFTPTGQISKVGLRAATGTTGVVPSGFATFVEPLIFIALALVQTTKRGHLGRWTGFLAFAGIVAVGLTLNRSSWFGLLIGLVTLELLLRRVNLSGRPLKVFVGLIIAAVIVYPFFELRLSVANDDLRIRLNLIPPAIRIIEDNPIIGVGPGAYGFVVRNYLEDFDGWLYIVHNEYLLIWAERGIVGLLAWLLWFGSGIRQASLAGRTAPQPFQAFAIGAHTGFIVLLWEWVLNMYEPFSATAIIWFLFGMLVATNRLFSPNRAGAEETASSARTPGFSGPLRAQFNRG
jgi:O-antigen ligase